MFVGSGIFRKTDELGRVTLPVELRNSIGIKDGITFLEISRNPDGQITLTKAQMPLGQCCNTDTGRCMCGNKCDSTMNFCSNCGNMLKPNKVKTRK